MRKIDADEQVGEGFLQDWYMNSVHGEPVWTEEHIEELCRDFIVIPKETPTVDEVIGEWKFLYETQELESVEIVEECSNCKYQNWRYEGAKQPNYCPHCGSKNREVE